MELLDAKNYTANFPFHTHPTYNITLVLERNFNTKLADRFLYAGPGSIVITHPGEVHASYCDAVAGSSFFTFYVSPDIMRRASGNQHFYFTTQIINDTALFMGLLQLSEDPHLQRKESANSFMQIMEKLVKRYGAVHDLSNSRRQLFRDFLLEANLENFSLSEAANRYGLDKFKFLRLFKQETGLTPNNYIILKRIEKCKELLRTGGDLLEIAVETGFYDATHLCRHFKKITGVTPQTYRMG